MSALLSLAVLPVVLPLVATAALLIIGESRRRLGSIVNMAATLAGLVVATLILWQVDAAGEAGAIAVYLTANWPAPYGITVVADRLSALMLVMAGLVGVGTALYASAGWSRAGSYFFPLLQILLMGVNGAFLTGDLFNLFVFFEVMLAASYGLQLHGSGAPRVQSGLHYIAINLLASSLFLIGLAVIYGVMGSLSMADVAARMPLVAESDRGLLHIGAVMLAMAFLIKAAIWPLNAWLVPAYTASSVPVAALFVVMTKVGLYAILRLWTLLFPAGAEVSAQFGASFLFAGGLLTLCFGALGVLASIRLDRIAAFSVIVSSGTLLAAFAVGSIEVGSAALFYLVNATLATSALFLLVEVVKRTRSETQTRHLDAEALPDEDDNLDDNALPLVGRAFPISVAGLALAFLVCALLVAGLPPLAGFLAKAALLQALVHQLPATEMNPSTIGPHGTWLMIVLIVSSGLFATISLARAGIRHFWLKGGVLASQLRAAEAGAVLLLLLASLGLAVFAEPALRYTQATSRYLHAPQPYVDAVLGARARPGPATPAIDEGSVR
ncbi:monovalent cation/H+ antiporter subunit D [Dokdonella sp.]|uniref:monovalent cation/H+ antiporter subunit D n=1 Tax=Dokdonella sp. TaxID=2291710 RepID=UPI002B93620D|nr:monovalent cation/H+ antiporter subunit D [Dokdonella sp.]HOX71340.1 monovalent cation/H+ antiporter subunit D [Dokdonella sp.]HPN80140.1 monovalent cation/H+ antiporter subunit D [Dokdonella sp.]